MLRAGSSRWPPKYEAMQEAYAGSKINVKSGRTAKHYKCNDCGNDFPAKEVQVDHIEPVIDPHKGFINWDTVIERMFCEADGFQVLCTICHKKKTDQEKLIAKQRKKNNE